jgi:glycosyltransferase involved in cell wall biosynthesis
MPTINTTHLQKAYTSIVNQTLKDWELIVFNNNPKRELKFEDKRVTLIDTDNMPLAKCFNQGTKISRSNIIMHHCDDDISMPHRAEITYNEIRRGADLFCGSFIALDECMKVRHLYNVPDKFDYEFFRKSGCNIPLMVAGYKKNKAPLYREGFPKIHDYVFLMEYHRKGMKYKGSMTPLAFRITGHSSFQQKNFFDKEDENKRVRELFNDPEMRTVRPVAYI